MAHFVQCELPSLANSSYSSNESWRHAPFLEREREREMAHCNQNFLFFPLLKKKNEKEAKVTTSLKELSVGLDSFVSSSVLVGRLSLVLVA